MTLVLAADGVSAQGQWNWSVQGMKSAVEAELGLDESSAARETLSQYSDTNRGVSVTAESLVRNSITCVISV